MLEAIALTKNYGSQTALEALADGDEVILKGYAESPRASRIGFGAGAIV